MSLEHVIFANLIHNEEYTRKVIPFLKHEYFTSDSDKVIYDIIDSYFKNYNALPSTEALAIDISKLSLNENIFKSAITTLQSLTNEKTDINWLLNTTEKFCQEKAVYNGIMKSIQIFDDKKGTLDKGAIPQILSDALAVSFDTSVGHDFIEDGMYRYEYYHNRESRVGFDIDLFNEITAGGFPIKTLNVFMAGVGVGKTLIMCHLACNNLREGKNVLYITNEMAEERIAERCDANLMDVPIADLQFLSREIYEKKLNLIKNRYKGKLVIKEYPTATASASHFRYLLNELKIKNNFVPDIIYIDYLNICASSRLKMGSNVNSYLYIKSIAEELRGLAIEFEVPIVSATQVNRSGFSDSDFGMDSVSESFGLPATLDFMMALITSDELAELGQILCKQLKNRYTDLNLKKRFVIGVDKSKMRVYNTDQAAQDDIVDDRPLMDRTKFGEEDSERSKPKSKFNRDAFKNFK